MVTVNGTSKRKVPLEKTTVGQHQWFEYHGELYLSIHWYGDVGKTLRAVCFDSQYGTIEAQFAEDHKCMVTLINDSKVMINYIAD